MMAGTLPQERATELADLLSTGTWTHDYPISPQAAKELGLNISAEIPDDVLELMSRYPQPVLRGLTGCCRSGVSRCARFKT